MSGYKIIDLKKKPLTTDGSAVNIPGIYEAVENSFGKPLLVDNIVIDGVEKNARFVVFGIDAGNYKGGMGYTPDGDVMGITITNYDMVAITSTI